MSSMPCPYIVLTPGRYVGAKAQQDDGAPCAQMERRVAQRKGQPPEAARRDEAITVKPIELWGECSIAHSSAECP